jgi:hypothetical protein
MRVETVRPNGSDTWVVGLVGTQSERFRSVTLSAKDLKTLTVYETACTFDGDGKLLRIGLQAYSLGIAYEFDPYFGLSISRVDPLPHQLEAITCFPLLLYQLAKTGQDEVAVLFNPFVCERAERLEEYSSGSFVGLGGSSETTARHTTAEFFFTSTTDLSRKLEICLGCSKRVM